MSTKLEQIRDIARTQFNASQSGASWYRILKLAEDAIADQQLQQQEDGSEYPRGRRIVPGTDAFNNYVFQKVNSPKDVTNIARRHNITEDEVWVAYGKGQWF